MRRWWLLVFATALLLVDRAACWQAFGLRGTHAIEASRGASVETEPSAAAAAAGWFLSTVPGAAAASPDVGPSRAWLALRSSAATAAVLRSPGTSVGAGAAAPDSERIPAGTSVEAASTGRTAAALFLCPLMPCRASVVVRLAFPVLAALLAETVDPLPPAAFSF